MQEQKLRVTAEQSMEYHVLAEMGVQENTYIVKSSREKYRTGKEDVRWNNEKACMFLTHIYVCMCMHMSKQARCLVKSGQINGRKQMGGPLGEVLCEQNNRNVKQKREELGHPESMLTTCTNLMLAVHSQLIQSNILKGYSICVCNDNYSWRLIINHWLSVQILI